jgi:hypothetical protein
MNRLAILCIDACQQIRKTTAGQGRESESLGADSINKSVPFGSIQRWGQVCLAG